MKTTAEEILSKIMERDEFYLSTTETSSIIGAMEAYAAQQVAEVTKQRDELLKAINSLLFMSTGKGEACGDLNWDTAERRAIAAIKSIEQ